MTILTVVDIIGLIAAFVVDVRENHKPPVVCPAPPDGGQTTGYHGRHRSTQ